MTLHNEIANSCRAKAGHVASSGCDLTLMRDEKLYELCRKYGSAARLWRQKFIGLLPEVNRRRLYEEAENQEALAQQDFGSG